MHANQSHLDTRTIYVVGWRSMSTGGFDWYRNRAAADDAFTLEKANCLEYAGERWEAFRFDLKVPLRLSDAAVTDLIDGDLDHYLENAAARFIAPAAAPAIAQVPALHGWL